MSDNSVTTCATILVAFFQKQRQKKYGGCTCHCHTYKNKNKSTLQLTELNDHKFFHCKCNQQCSKNAKQRKYKAHRKRLKSGGKMLIEHTGSMSSIASPNTKVLPPAEKFQSRERLRNTLTFCTSYGKDRTISITSPSTDHQQRLENFHASPFCRRTPHVQRKDDNSDNLREKSTSQDVDVKNQPKSYYEWTIPYEKIELGDVEATSQKGPVYRGRWHGDVMFYTRSHATEEEINDFHDEVALLGLIRHENVVLFMGACIQPPNLAVVTSVRKGHTLYEHLHLRKTSFHFGSKFSIAKQIAQGMGYLHAKGIALGKLCSRNIFLESKVKIGITDYTMANEPIVKSGYGCVPKGHLMYISPELMRSLSVQSLYLLPMKKSTQRSDVYAYGTLVYEIFFARYPFRDLSPSAIIWKISKGMVPSLEETDFPASFKGLIQSCWLPHDVTRPEFHEIISNMKKFNIPRSLQKKLSLSDSGAINRNHVLNSPFHRLNASPARNPRWKKE